jgi:drug/metabolite transporter (DMT)-like permease
MVLSRTARQRLLFAVLCVVWGATWLALKVGVTAVPPGFFSGTRWTVAGLLLFGWRRAQGKRLRIRRRLIGRITLVAVLMVLMNALIQNYGLRYVGSGLASVISSALMPIGLMTFSVALGQEQFSRRQGWATALGICGIFLLFGPSALAGRMDASELLGALGVIVGTLTYALGSVLSRPLMLMLTPAEIAASTNLIGGVLLLTLSVLFEPGAREAMTGDWGIAAWTAWLFLLLPGSLGATVIYFVLVRDWGASRTGTYAFVSPVVAVLLGITLLGEQIELSSALGMAVMLVAAGIALKRS